MDINYVPGLGHHVAIEDDRVIDVDTNQDSLIERVGEPTASSAATVFNDQPDVTEVVGAMTGDDEDNAVYLDGIYRGIQ